LLKNNKYCVEATAILTKRLLIMILMNSYV